MQERVVNTLLFFVFTFVSATTLCSDPINYQAVLDELSAQQCKTAVDYYNMGVCAHHLGKPYESAVFWNYAASIADPQLSDTIAQCMKDANSCAIQYEKKRFDFVHTTPVFYLQIVALLLALALLCICLWTPRFILPTWLVCAAGMLCLLAAYYMRSNGTAVVAESCDVRVGPGEHYMKILQLSQGATVAILEQHKSWYKVQSLNPQGAPAAKGWIAEHKLIRI